MKKIDLGSDEDFIKNYQQLKSSRKMGELYNCTKGVILRHAKEIGYDPSGNKEIKLPINHPEEVIQLYEQLQSATAVGEYYHCSGTAVLNLLKKHNYTIINPTKDTFFNITDDEFILSYEELKSAKKMGERYGCSATAILNHAKKINYNPLDNKEYKLTPEAKEDIIKNYNNMTSNELAKKYQVSRGMITKIWYDNHLFGKQINITKTTEIDITGQTFGYWTVQYKTDKRNTGGVIYWHCKCICGVERDITGTSLRNGTSLSCGNHYNLSKGNLKVQEILTAAKIPFTTEKRFDSCKDKRTLPFDFYVDNKYLIEYDGSQHYDKDSIYDYEYTHSHDLIKSKWCKDNNIPLIRIPYTHYDDLCLNDLLLETSKFIEK